MASSERRSGAQGYFAFRDAVCYGHLDTGGTSAHLTGDLADAFDAVTGRPRDLQLPFDLSEVADNLRRERYQMNGRHLLSRMTAAPATERVYYFLRPMLNVGVRKHLQRIRLHGWDQIPFPRWPVDTSVDVLMRRVLGLAMQAGNEPRIPFVWFWPDGAECALMMTHDVEGRAGLAFCGELMDVDDAHGVKSAFQLIPEGNGSAWQTLAGQMRRRGFEVNLHDLNHDGGLFRTRDEFLERAGKINRYARDYGCAGFRSGAMYRRQQWYDAFEFSFDMSVPNVAHLEPQRGGCCTVMPYFVGDLLELPLTTTQDYSLFHILGDYSMALWQQQIDAIRAQNGLMTFLAHPDYLADRRALAVYRELLVHLEQLRESSRIWMALPSEIDRWWRDRRQMTVVPHGNTWRIDGPGARRARLAFASLDGDRVRYSLDGTPSPS